MKAQDETIYNESGNRVLEVRKLRESLVARRKYGKAFIFMQLELTLVQGLEMRASVGASFSLCSVMEQTKSAPLLFYSAKLGLQLSDILVNVIPQMGEQASQLSIELLRQIFPQMEVRCPGISYDLAVKLVRDSPLTEINKSLKYMDLSNTASERGDFTKVNQALIAAWNLAEKNWHQHKQLPSGGAALQHLHNLHIAYISFHQRQTGMAFFESAGVADYMVTLFIHYKNYKEMLQVFKEFQGR